MQSSRQPTHFGRFFTGQITAAGKVPPAKVFVIGAGVAGLASLGTAVGLGAIVRANDTRPEVADQVKSMGAEFVPVDYQEEGTGVGGYAKVMSEGFQKAQLETFAKQAKDVDIIITTALIPGKPAPRLITAEMVKSMRPGSVIVDLAAEQGGNCELTEPGQVVVRHGVTIIGYTDLPSRLAKQASTLYATNLLRLTEELCKTRDGKIDVNFDDEVLRGTTVIKAGEITWPPPPPKIRGSTAAGKACRSSRRRRRSPVTAMARASRCRLRSLAVIFARWRRAVLAGRCLCTGLLPVALHGVRAGLLHRLHGDLERQTLAAHAADERDQCDIEHHRRRRAGADRTTAEWRGGGQTVRA